MAAAMKALNVKTAFSGSKIELRSSSSSKTVRAPVAVRAQQEQGIDRRSALGLVAAAAALVTRVAPSQAGYGDSARVFASKITNKSGFVPYAAEDYALLLPSRWNPSKERDFPGVELRYEDNGDAVNMLFVLKKETDKKSITDFGAPDQFLNSVAYLFGESTFYGQSRSEGGFAANKYAAASILDVSSAEKGGKTYYKYELLTRSADGDEGGRHHLLTAAVSNGTLYIYKVQIGDKRWFKGAKKDAVGSFESFQIA